MPTPSAGKRRPGSVAKGGPGVAAQAVTLASTILQFAVGRGLRADNPARGIRKPPVKKMTRFLSEAELGRLSDALAAEIEAGGNLFPVAAIKLLALIGARRSEVIKLLWRNVDLDHSVIRLDDSKTGEKPIYLSPAAVEILAGLPRVAGNEFVIAGGRAGRPFVGIDKIWDRVRRRAGLAEVRLHDLRHSFASVGAAGGLGLPVIGALLGHASTVTTQRYAHLSSDPLRAAADAIGGTIAAAMAGDKGAEVIPLPGKRARV